MFPYSEPLNTCTVCEQKWEGNPYEYETEEHQFPCPNCSQDFKISDYKGVLGRSFAWNAVWDKCKALGMETNGSGLQSVLSFIQGLSSNGETAIKQELISSVRAPEWTVLVMMEPNFSVEDQSHVLPIVCLVYTYEREVSKGQYLYIFSGARIIS